MYRTLRASALLPLLLSLTIACDSKEPEEEEEEVIEDTEEPPVESTWYADSDGDGYGDSSAAMDAVEQPDGYVEDSTDCNDTNGSQYPGADELCNEEDDDCDGETDEDATDAGTYYVDSDNDTYGNPEYVLVKCTQPAGSVLDNTDCNDDSNLQHPGADELCNEEDDDCDGDTDEDAVDVLTWYADNDNDGYGDPDNTTGACTVPTGYLGDSSDCDDTDELISPDAEDTADGIDQDCDGFDGYPFTEDFESFTVGDYIGYSSYNFATWTTGGEGGTEDAPVTDEESYSTGTQAVVLNEDEGDDLVLLLGPTSGSWLIEWYLYVDTGAYFNLQGLPAPFGDWQKEVHIDDDGLVYDDGTSTGLEVSAGQWVPVQYYVDMDVGTQELWIDNIEVISDYFTGTVLGGIDFYPTPSSGATTEEAINFYIDDVAFSEL